MATERKAKERVPNYPDLFSELEGGTSGNSLSTSEKPRKRLKKSLTGNYREKPLKTLERRNMKVWEALYPTPNKRKDI